MASRSGTNSPRAMMDAVAGSMQARTGRTLEAWVALVKDSGLDPLDQNAVRRWLKAEYDVLQNSRYAIADAAARAAGWTAPSVDEYVAAQYSGAKAALRPAFDMLRTLLLSFGTDVHAEGRASYIPFVRRRQFAAVAPAARSRIDIGLRFTAPPSSPLLSTAGVPGQGTHKVSVTSPEEITAEVERLLRAAYDQNGAA
jgi:predicted transport protein